MRTKPVVFGVCGWSGSGKTTVVHGILTRLCAMGLKVAVVKHDIHGINIDHPGKDSDRFFRAGADVLLQGPDEEVLRFHGATGQEWGNILDALAWQYDVVLVEGHKSMPIPKVWLLSDCDTAPPDGLDEVIAVLPRHPDNIARVMALIEERLPQRKME